MITSTITQNSIFSLDALDSNLLRTAWLFGSSFSVGSQRRSCTSAARGGGVCRGTWSALLWCLPSRGSQRLCALRCPLVIDNGGSQGKASWSYPTDTPESNRVQLRVRPYWKRLISAPGATISLGQVLVALSMTPSWFRLVPPARAGSSLYAARH